MSVVPENVQKEVRAVLLSKIGGVPLNRFNRDFKNLIGHPCDWRGLGFRSLIDCVKAMPHVVRIDSTSGETKLFGIGDGTSFMTKSQIKAARGMISPEHAGVQTPVSSTYNGPEPDLSKFEKYVPNLNGLFAVCFKRQPHHTEENVHALFSTVGAIASVNFSQLYVFVRYPEKLYACRAILKFKELGITIPVERSSRTSSPPQKTPSFMQSNGVMEESQPLPQPSSIKPLLQPSLSRPQQRPNSSQPPQQPSASWPPHESNTPPPPLQPSSSEDEMPELEADEEFTSYLTRPPPLVSEQLIPSPNDLKLFIGNIPKHVNEHDLMRLFQGKGVTHVQIVTTGFKPYAFAFCQTSEQASAIVRDFHGFQFYGHILKVAKFVSKQIRQAAQFEQLARTLYGHQPNQLSEVYKPKPSSGRNSPAPVYKPKPGSGRNSPAPVYKPKPDSGRNSPAPNPSQKTQQQSAQNKRDKKPKSPTEEAPKSRKHVENSEPKKKSDKNDKKSKSKTSQDVRSKSGLKTSQDARSKSSQDPRSKTSQGARAKSSQDSRNQISQDARASMPELNEATRKGTQNRKGGCNPTISETPNSSHPLKTIPSLLSPLELAALSDSQPKEDTKPRLAGNEKKMELKITNFPFHTTEDEILALLSPYNVFRVRIKNNKNKPTLAFADCLDRVSAERAIADLNGSMQWNRRLTVSFGSMVLQSENMMKGMMDNVSTLSLEPQDTSYPPPQSASYPPSQITSYPPPPVQASPSNNTNMSFPQPKPAASPSTMPSAQPKSSMSQSNVQSSQNKPSLTPTNLPSATITPTPHGSTSSPNISSANVTQAASSSPAVSPRNMTSVPVSTGTGGEGGIACPVMMKSMIMRMKTQDMPPLPDSFSVLVTSVVDKHHFWGHLVDFKENLEKLMRLMTEITAQTTRIPLTEGQNRCAALYEEEWCRAWIKEYLPNNMYRVFYPDYGNTAVVSLDEMCEIPNKYWMLPPQAIPFRSIVPRDDMPNLEYSIIQAKKIKDCLASREPIEVQF